MSDSDRAKALEGFELAYDYAMVFSRNDLIRIDEFGNVGANSGGTIYKVVEGKTYKKMDR
jgi:hypothetical protein